RVGEEERVASPDEDARSADAQLAGPRAGSSDPPQEGTVSIEDPDLLGLAVSYVDAPLLVDIDPGDQAELILGLTIDLSQAKYDLQRRSLPRAPGPGRRVAHYRDTCTIHHLAAPHSRGWTTTTGGQSHHGHHSHGSRPDRIRHVSGLLFGGRE